MYCTLSTMVSDNRINPSGRNPLSMSSSHLLKWRTILVLKQFESLGYRYEYESLRYRYVLVAQYSSPSCVTFSAQTQLCCCSVSPDPELRIRCWNVQRIQPLCIYSENCARDCVFGFCAFLVDFSAVTPFLPCCNDIIGMHRCCQHNWSRRK